MPKKENLINIKENFHIYRRNQNEMFDIIVNINTRPQTRHNTQGV
jgi:hypothetical protein